MKKLIVTRGAPGAGKSTALSNLGLSHYTVSPDSARLMMSGPELSSDGAFQISQQINREAWQMAMETLEKRMRKGEMLAFDATFPTASELQPVLALAKKRHYDVRILNFFNVPEETCLRQNSGRGEPKRVPTHAITRAYANYAKDIDTTIDVPQVMWSQNGDHEKAISEFLSVETVDLNQYRKVVHLSDNQGCFAVMFGEQSPLKSGFQDDCFYIHHGDLIDRGTEHAKVVRWAIEALQNQTNFILLKGNHEEHIIRYCDGEEPVSKEFATQTLPDLNRHGLYQKEMQAIVDGARDVFAYRHGKTEVLCTHAGLPIWPKRLELVSSEQYYKGPGYYESDVDTAFSTWSLQNEKDTGTIKYQVHGHRNSAILPILAAPRSINLEGQVEFGGHLRFAELENDTFKPLELRNKVYRTLAEFHEIDQVIHSKDRQQRPGSMPIPGWIGKDKPQVGSISEKLIEEMRGHEMIAERRSAVLPHVSAFNFTREAFEDKNWDTLSLRARGMFIDTESRHIVARSYEKFFNWGEVPSTSPEYLRANLKFPVTAYRKENGFLGIVGYDEKTESLIVTSKSMMDSDFSGWFQGILDITLSAGSKERLLRYLRDAKASAVFEVIDPVRDPHIISYEKAHVVLLDVIARDLKFMKLPYNDLKRVGQLLGVEIKQRTATLQNWQALMGFVTQVTQDQSYQEKQGHIEGYVLEDSDNRFIKIKSGYYAFWKKMRGMKDRILLSRTNNKPITKELTPEETRFYNFCIVQPSSVLEKSIIELREAFMADPNQVLYGETPEPVVKKPKHEGFIKGFDIVAEQVKTNTAKYESVRKMLDSLEKTPERMKLVANTESFRILTDFANFGHTTESQSV